MQATRDEVIQFISKLPESVSTDDIMEEIYFKFKVDKALEQLNSEEGIPHEEIEKRVNEWLG